MAPFHCTKWRGFSYPKSPTPWFVGVGGIECMKHHIEWHKFVSSVFSHWNDMMEHQAEHRENLACNKAQAL